MTLIRLLALAVPTFFASVLNAAAASETYTFDPAHTEVRFCWNHLGFSRQCAHFVKYEGELLTTRPIRKKQRQRQVRHR
jgi:polyisoprenoid-binding protein YceI